MLNLACDGLYWIKPSAWKVRGTSNEIWVAAEISRQLGFCRILVHLVLQTKWVNNLAYLSHHGCTNVPNEIVRKSLKLIWCDLLHSAIYIYTCIDVPFLFRSCFSVHCDRLKTNKTKNWQFLAESWEKFCCFELGVHENVLRSRKGITEPNNSIAVDGGLTQMV